MTLRPKKGKRFVPGGCAREEAVKAVELRARGLTIREIAEALQYRTGSRQCRSRRSAR